MSKQEWIVKPMFDNDGFHTGYEKTGEVVRCRECRWYKKREIIGRDDGYCKYTRMTQDGLQYINANPDDFCSYGERRTDE